MSKLLSASWLMVSFFCLRSIFFTSPLVNSAANEQSKLQLWQMRSTRITTSLLSGTRRSAYSQGLYYSFSCTLITHFTRRLIYISPSFYYTSPPGWFADGVRSLTKISASFKAATNVDRACLAVSVPLSASRHVCRAALYFLPLSSGQFDNRKSAAALTDDMCCTVPPGCFRTVTC